MGAGARAAGPALEIGRHSTDHHRAVGPRRFVLRLAAGDAHARQGSPAVRPADGTALPHGGLRGQRLLSRRRPTGWPAAGRLPWCRAGSRRGRLAPDAASCRGPALARQWVAQSRLRRRPDRESPGCWRQQLGVLRRFHYSLQGEDRDLSIDAIRISSRTIRAGHCEYFATALAMMLRSQGIPVAASSWATGATSGTSWASSSRFGNFTPMPGSRPYRAGQVPGYSAAGDDDDGLGAPGGWLRLDATPAAEVGTTAADSSMLGQWGKPAAPAPGAPGTITSSKWISSGSRRPSISRCPGDSTVVGEASPTRSGGEPCSAGSRGL